MIYQICLVIVLLIISEIDAAELPEIFLKRKEPFSKEEVKAFEEKYKVEEKIEWGWIFGQTKEVPIGIYASFKKDGEKLKYRGLISVDGKGLGISLTKQAGFSFKDTYVIYGAAHDGMKFNGEGYPSNFGELSSKEMKWIKSAEKCFMKNLIIMITIGVVILLACCGCCFFCYRRTKRSRR